MSVIDKMKKITDSLENKNDNENFNKNSSTGTFKNIFINYIEEHKGVRRIILFVILWINVHIFLVSVNMYKTNLFLDQQWVIFAGYWVGILTTIVAFYTTGRTKEHVAKINKMQNIDQKQVDKWKFKPNNNIKFYDEDDSDNREDGY